MRYRAKSRAASNCQVAAPSPLGGDGWGRCGAIYNGGASRREDCLGGLLGLFESVDGHCEEGSILIVVRDVARIEHKVSS